METSDWVTLVLCWESLNECAWRLRRTILEKKAKDEKRVRNEFIKSILEKKKRFKFKRRGLNWKYNYVELCADNTILIITWLGCQNEHSGTWTNEFNQSTIDQFEELHQICADKSVIRIVHFAFLRRSIHSQRVLIFSLILQTANDTWQEMFSNYV